MSRKGKVLLATIGAMTASLQDVGFPTMLDFTDGRCQCCGSKLLASGRCLACEHAQRAEERPGQPLPPAPTRDALAAARARGKAAVKKGRK